MQNNNSNQLAVLVVAPFGRDAGLIAGALQRANIPCELCPDPRFALSRLSQGAGAVLVEEEVFNDVLIQEFAATLQGQPAWSDAPVLVLTKGRSGTNRATALMARMRQPLGHTTLLERPIRPETLVSAVETALRARLRQFQMRDAVEQLRASEARYRSLIVAASSIVWTADSQGNVVERLPSWEAYTGQSFEEYWGSGWNQAIHPKDRPAALASAAAAMRVLRPFQLEYRLRRYDDQYRWIVSRGVPVFREDSTVKEWVGTCTDIQDRKDAEIALHKSEHLALAGQLAAGIAHEINNPLEAVTNLIYLINTRATDDETRQFCAMAQHELTRVSEISGQTLRFYRKSTQPVETDVAELLQSLLQLFQPKFRRRSLQLHTQCNGKTRVMAFPNELRQLFANLISNAIDATPPGGDIWIKSGNAVDWRDAKENGIRVIVADNGSGIAEGMKRRILEPFVTTKGDSGTGLGLWVCDDIVKRHGGDLKLKSRTTDPSGTVFSIFLPAGYAPEPQSSELASVHGATKANLS